MMTPANSDEQLRLARLEQAGQWLLRMQDTKRTDGEMDEWLRWIDADPQNLAEFERLQRDWIDLEALKGELPVTLAQGRALDEQGNNHVAARYSTGRFAGGRRAWVLAAGIAAVALALSVSRDVWVPAPPSAQQVAATLINRAATLPDGSKMILGAQSRVDMDFNGAKRRLDLARGEAYFEVQHDKSRPFVVQAGEVSVTAIGTAFDVRRDHQRVTITVEEGTVEVSSRPAGRPAVTWRAEAGYQLTYSTRDRTASLASVNPAAELAWRDGELAYVHEPLAAVVEDLSRYSTRKILIEDPAIAALPFTGTAFASSLDDWLAGVEQAYPITVRRTADGDIVLSAKQ